MSPAYNRFRRFAAILIGIVFLGSGLLKLMDPVGTGLIVTEYFRFLHLKFLIPLARVTGILLALVETLTGCALITGVFRRLTAVVTSVLITFFTILTLVLLIVNPEMDCGCFGEAIHLTHLQSFLKNVALLLLGLIAFTPYRDFGQPRKGRQWAFWLVAPTFVLVLWYNAVHLPLVDLMAFAPGARLMASEDQEDAPEPFNAAFIYERDGQTASFTLDRLPDSTWTFVGVDTLSRAQFPPRVDRPILSFSDASGNYRDDLAAQGKAVVLSVYNPAKADWDRVVEQYRRVEEAGARPLLLVSASAAELSARALPVEAYSADYKTLLTLNRGNGGATYLDAGEVIAKWSPTDFPQDLSATLQADPVNVTTDFRAGRRIKAQGYVLYLAALLLLL